MRGESEFMRSTFNPASNSYSGGGHPDPARRGTPADAETARFFLELRRYLRLSTAEVAHRIGTHPDIIAALESGRIDRLPVWSETARIVTSYIGMARLDPRPALERLSVLMRVSVTAGPHLHHTAATPARSAAASPVSRIVSRLSDAAARAKSGSGWSEWLTEWKQHIGNPAKALAEVRLPARAPVRRVLAAAFALVIVASVAPSGVLQASVGGIAQPISGLWRKLSGEGSAVRVIIRDGLKWIEADDPRERRSDKLPSRRS
ncbi:MAG: hypothetical protein MUC37_08185 [Hyphomicrobium sp.]|nr:hypothetical protein [Hyphomicrobium sp.]